MTAVQDATPQTSSDPRVRDRWRRLRGPIALAVVVAVISVAAAVLRSAPGGLADPRSYTPQGSRAIAALLEDQGVPVTVVETVEGLAAEDVTVVVPFPAALTASELERVGATRGRVVVIGADQNATAALGLPDLTLTDIPIERRRPACELPEAVRAGDVDLGGIAYRAEDQAIGCYASGGSSPLLVAEQPDRVLLGSGSLLTNDRIDERGNAALAVALLGSQPRVQWLLPLPGIRDTDQRGGLNDLLPDEIRWGAWQLGVVVLALALWRVRRFGRVVTEPLPVVVRAAEAVEGRSRLYRAAQARGRAAEALRAGCRDRIARRLGLPPTVGRAALVEAVSRRVGRPAEGVYALLYGAEPAADAALVRLAADLDALDLEVAGS